MISPATVRMTTCRKVQPNRMASFFSTSAGIRARIGASLSRRAIAYSFPRGRAGGDGATGGDGAGGDGGSTRRGRAGTAGPERAGTVPPLTPVAAGRVGAENTDMTGAGGRFGAVCERGAAENVAAGTDPLAGRLGVLAVGALLNTTGTGR